MPQKYLRIEGVATHLHLTGPTTLPEELPDLSRGEAIICLHGAAGNGAVFGDLLEKLGEQHSPLAFDQPGHARSGGLDSLGSIERMSAFTLALLDKLGLDAAVLLGHSMGGMVALRTALDRPERVKALVLVSSGPRAQVPDVMIDMVRRVTQGRERRQFRREAYSPSTPGEIVRKGFMQDMQTDPRAGLGDLLALRDFDAREELAGLRVPTLVAVGDDEFPELRKGSDLLAERVPGARLVVVPKAGHMLPLEQPGRLADAVNEFLAELAQ